MVRIWYLKIKSNRKPLNNKAYDEFYATQVFNHMMRGHFGNNVIMGYDCTTNFSQWITKNDNNRQA